MGHVALYRQFRPVTFDEIVEQKHAVTALRQSVISGQIGHAYLFCGTRGTGKTTIAKIFSRAINCLAPRDGNPCNECEICRGILNNTLMDVIEMDAASNNSVDNIRRVCDEVMFLPSRAKYKVYIIDEVHMLSGGAFNALLKTLEEPPAHAVFLLATTEPHRIPATIISRCQRYDFRRIPMESMILRLQSIAAAQRVSIDHEALVTISNLSDGALRDAISLLDQVSTGVDRNITRDDVLRITGVVDDAFLYSMADALLTGDPLRIVTLTEQLVMDGRDMIRFTLDLAHYFRDLMVIRVAPDPENLVQATSDSMSQMQEIAGRTPPETLVFAVTRLSGLVSELKWSPDMRTSFEIALLSFGAGEHGSGRLDNSSSASVRSAAPVIPARAVPVPKSPTPEPAAVVPIAAAPGVSPFAAPAPTNKIESVPNLNQSSDTSGTKGRAYMPPPPIEDMFSQISLLNETPSGFTASSPAASIPVSSHNHSAPIVHASLSPMESTLQAPPEEEAYMPPPPDDIEGGLPLSELWALLLHKWEDTLFSEALLLKQASVYQKADVFYIVFSDNMKAYANSLTERADYKKINKDILTVVTGASSVEVQTESERDGLTDSNGIKMTAPSEADTQPDWVAQMLAFSEATGIPVETLDNL